MRVAYRGGEGYRRRVAPGKGRAWRTGHGAAAADSAAADHGRGAGGIGAGSAGKWRGLESGSAGQGAAGGGRGATFVDAARACGRRSGDAVAHLVERFNAEGLAAVEARHGGGPPLRYG